MRKIKILYVVNSLGPCNGITSYVMNYFKNIDESKILIDFLVCNNTGIDNLENEKIIFEKKSKIFYIEQIGIRNFFKVLKKMDNFFKENANRYDIIHCHLLNNGAFFLHFAKKYKIKHRILHSHVTKSADTKLKKIRNDLLLPIAINNATDFFACSDDAGKFIFKNKRYLVIKNAIYPDRFIYNEEKRKVIRKKMNIDSNYVYGNIGRLCPQKNQLFLLDIFKNIKLRQKNAKLIMVGDGPWKEKIEEKIKRLDLAEDVILLPSMENIEDMYQVFDMFLFPSNYEGLGIVLVEAQVSGLKCLTSNMVPKETKIIQEYISENISNTAEQWASTAIDFANRPYVRNTRIQEVVDNNYDIKEQAKKLEKIYMQIVGEENKNGK